MPSFSNKKQLKFVITLGVNTFNGTAGANQIILQGYRAVVDVDRAGGVQMGTLRARIYGLTENDINSITTYQMQQGEKPQNTVEVYAIDGDAQSLAFMGNIVRAWGDYQNAPDVFLTIQAQAAYFNQLRTIAPVSYKGGIPVATIMQNLAATMGYQFENNGVTAILVDPYLSSNALDQMREVAAAARITAIIDNDTLAIFPIGGWRQGNMPLISPESGLIGYPTFDGVLMQSQILYNPGVVQGCKVTIQSAIKQACGEWIIGQVSHRLESERVGGMWSSLIRGTRDGLAIVRQ